jgi:uncharacterized protein (TIGR02246 family)
MRRLAYALATAAALAATAANRSSAQQPAAAPTGAAALFAKFSEAFNKHDAQAIGALMAEDVVYVGQAIGRLEGRAAVADAYAALFKADPKIILAVQLHPQRPVVQGVEAVDGNAIVTHGDGATSASTFTATLVRNGDAWQLKLIHESDLPLPPSLAAERLAALDWLLGRWEDETPEHSVTNEFRRSGSGAFITRTFSREAGGDTTHSGTQVIGWDEEGQTFRSWLFGDDGSFGEGYFHPESPEKWINKTVLKLPDGRRGSLTQIVERRGDDQFTIQSIDAEIDGEALPNSEPATMNRQTAEPVIK